MIRNVINDGTLKWRLQTCFEKNVERLQKLFQSTLVHFFSAHVGHVPSHSNGFRKSAILLLTNSLFLSYAYQKWQATTFRLYEHIQATHLTIF